MSTTLCISYGAVHCVGLSTGRADSDTTDRQGFNTGCHIRMTRTQEATEYGRCASLTSTLSATQTLVTFSFITPTLNHKATNFPEREGTLPCDWTWTWDSDITFAKHSAMYTIDSPIKVVNANCFHKFTAGAMKQHLLIDLRDTSLLLELSLFPKITKHPDINHRKIYQWVISINLKC